MPIRTRLFGGKKLTIFVIKVDSGEEIPHCCSAFVGTHIFLKINKTFMIHNTALLGTGTERHQTVLLVGSYNTQPDTLGFRQ
jgi:hypothetical protein